MAGTRAGGPGGRAEAEAGGSRGGRAGARGGQRWLAGKSPETRKLRDGVGGDRWQEVPGREDGLWGVAGRACPVRREPQKPGPARVLPPRWRPAPLPRRTHAPSPPPADVLLSAEVSGGDRLDCVKASDQCLKEQSCSTKYRTLRQCVAGKETNFSLTSGLEAKDECRSAMEALKQKSLYNCRCKRGMKKEKNCLRIYWSMYQSLQGTRDRLRSPPPAPEGRGPLGPGVWLTSSSTQFSPAAE